ncbi:uncharacterized protein TNCV_3297271 [Trichonephila clavipes]|uniref:Uncharacterized protein n=1 Tax=Trichonephila clavipes TaxID=2585209 RepID=A0A8X6T998_TRICX|nr:uncharacterized protein TNCV_3297271 [Trichonephila clavipes]
MIQKKFWFREFKAWNFRIDDEPRSIEVDSAQLKQVIDQDRSVSTRTIALELDVCQKILVNPRKRINLNGLFCSAQRSKEREHSG